MKRKLSGILIISGAVLLLVAGGLYTYNRIYDYQAGIRAQTLLDQMMATVGWDLPPLEEMVYRPAPVANEPDLDLSVDDNEETSAEPLRPQMDIDLDVETLEYGGTYITFTAPASNWSAPTYTTIGVLSIPKLNVRLPVIGECSDALLNISCCRISGLAEDKPNRLVISGHNIWSHFKGLDTIKIGDQIAFTTVNGETYYYQAIEFVDLHKTEGADVLATVGWDITLITCKTNNTYRTVVRFAEIT